MELYFDAIPIYSGRTTFLYRWWKRSQCPEFSEMKISGTQSLTMEKVAGIFVVLCGGVIVGLAVAGAEYLYRIHQVNIKSKNRVC